MSSVRVFDLEAPERPKRPFSNDTRPRYRGRIKKVSRDGAYAFVDYRTIVGVTGKEPRVPIEDDLILHIRRNRTLGEELPQRGALVNFVIERDISPRSRDGYEAIIAYFE